MPMPSLSSSFIREVICYNQGAYVQYTFLAGEHHKRLKDALHESPTDIDALRKLCSELEGFLNKQLYGVSLQNFRFIKAYFRGYPHDREPRLCIKGHYKEGELDYIVPLVREKRVSYRSKYALESNSGFLYVNTHGRHFKCDDIPESIVADDYRNARINTSLARAYHAEPATSSEDHSFQFDQAWINCWDSPSPVDPSSCYKSTIIIPMTLWNNKLDESFLRKLRDKQTTDIDMKAQTIFGYLCLDHVEAGYFNDDSDIDVGYIFADILSLYLITQAIYTTLSTTYSKVNRILCPDHS